MVNRFKLDVILYRKVERRSTAETAIADNEAVKPKTGWEVYPQVVIGGVGQDEWHSVRRKACR